MTAPIKIIDIIHHRNKYDTQIFHVIDRMPIFLYERKDGWLIAEDSGFFSFFRYEQPTRHFQAFAGRQFTIPLKGGGCLEATGQWWDGIKPDYRDLLVSVAVGTPEGLGRCNVFSGMWADPLVLECDITPSNNYYKYSVRDPEYQKHTIISKWETEAALAAVEDNHGI